MAVGILLITHIGMGCAIIAAAKSVMGTLPAELRAVEFTNGTDANITRTAAAKALRELDQGDGVLILTDLYGSTPSNIAANLNIEGVPMRRVSGVNLPMLLRILNYRDQALDDLVLTAAAGARSGVVIDHG